MTTTLHDLAWPARTERLLLRPLDETDSDAVFAYRSRPEVARWMGGHQGERAAFDAWFLRPDRIGRTLVVEHGGEVVGDLMLLLRDGWAQVEVAERARAAEAVLGWCLEPAHQGRGLATEAVRALLAVAFEALGARRVLADCFVANEASWRLMERVGMRREQHGVEDSLHAELGWVDGLAYALLATEWRTAGRVGAPLCGPGSPGPVSPGPASPGPVSLRGPGS